MDACQKFQSITFHIKIKQKTIKTLAIYIYTRMNIWKKKSSSFFSSSSFIWSCQMDITYLVKTRGKDKCFYEMKQQQHRTTENKLLFFIFLCLGWAVKNLNNFIMFFFFSSMATIKIDAFFLSRKKEKEQNNNI